MRKMSKTIIITGGAASGKTRWAVSYLEECDNVLYLCTSDKMDTDTEKRIEFGNHKNYVAWEIRTGVRNSPADCFDGHKFFIFDNVGSYVANRIGEMCPDVESMTEDVKKSIEKNIIDDITYMYDKASELDGTLIVITTEMGFSVLPDNKAQIMFREILGNVNQRIANISNEVYLSVSGIQFKIKE